MPSSAAGGPTLRVALDVSRLVHARLTGSAPFGVGRVQAEWLRQLARETDLRVRPLSVCTSDPLRSSLDAERIFGGTERAYRSRSGSRRRWAAAYTALEVAEREGRTRSLARARTVLMKRVDAVPVWRDGGFDVFHSTWDALPSASATSGVRLLSMYDLIPFTDAATAALPGPREALLHIVASIDPSTHVVVNSRHTADEVMRILGLPPRRVHVVPLGAARGFYDAAPPVRPEALGAAGIGNRPYVLAVGLTQTRKNPELLVAAFARLTSDPTLDIPSLVVVGTSWLGEDALEESLLRRPEVRRHVIRIPTVTEHELRWLYGSATVFVHGAYAEGYGLPVVEAMAAGAPVIAADASSLPEVLGGAGRLVGAKDARGLAEALGDLLGDPAARARMRAASRERASELTFRASAARLAALYRELSG